MAHEVNDAEDIDLEITEAEVSSSDSESADEDDAKFIDDSLDDVNITPNQWAEWITAWTSDLNRPLSPEEQKALAVQGGDQGLISASLSQYVSQDWFGYILRSISHILIKTLHPPPRPPAIVPLLTKTLTEEDARRDWAHRVDKEVWPEVALPAGLPIEQFQAFPEEPAPDVEWQSVWYMNRAITAWDDVPLFLECFDHWQRTFLRDARKHQIRTDLLEILTAFKPTIVQRQTLLLYGYLRAHDEDIPVALARRIPRIWQWIFDMPNHVEDLRQWFGMTIPKTPPRAFVDAWRQNPIMPAPSTVGVAPPPIDVPVAPAKEVPPPLPQPPQQVVPIEAAAAAAAPPVNVLVPKSKRKPVAVEPIPVNKQVRVEAAADESKVEEGAASAMVIRPPVEEGAAIAVAVEAPAPPAEEEEKKQWWRGYAPFATVPDRDPPLKVSKVMAIADSIELMMSQKDVQKGIQSIVDADQRSPFQVSQIRTVLLQLKTLYEHVPSVRQSGGYPLKPLMDTVVQRQDHARYPEVFNAEEWRAPLAVRLALYLQYPELPHRVGAGEGNRGMDVDEFLAVRERNPQPLFGPQHVPRVWKPPPRSPVAAAVPMAVAVKEEEVAAAQSPAMDVNTIPPHRLVQILPERSVSSSAAPMEMPSAAPISLQRAVSEEVVPMELPASPAPPLPLDEALPIPPLEPDPTLLPEPPAPLMVSVSQAVLAPEPAQEPPVKIKPVIAPAPAPAPVPMVLGDDDLAPMVQTPYEIKVKEEKKREEEAPPPPPPPPPPVASASPVVEQKKPPSQPPRVPPLEIPSVVPEKEKEPKLEAVVEPWWVRWTDWPTSTTPASQLYALFTMPAMDPVTGERLPELQIEMLNRMDSEITMLGLLHEQHWVRGDQNVQAIRATVGNILQSIVRFYHDWWGVVLRKQYSGPFHVYILRLLEEARIPFDGAAAPEETTRRQPILMLIAWMGLPVQPNARPAVQNAAPIPPPAQPAVPAAPIAQAALANRDELLEQITYALNALQLHAQDPYDIERYRALADQVDRATQALLRTFDTAQAPVGRGGVQAPRPTLQALITAQASLRDAQVENMRLRQERDADRVLLEAIQQWMPDWEVGLQELRTITAAEHVEAQWGQRMQEWKALQLKRLERLKALRSAAAERGNKLPAGGSGGVIPLEHSTVVKRLKEEVKARQDAQEKQSDLEMRLKDWMDWGHMLSSSLAATHTEFSEGLQSVLLEHLGVPMDTGFPHKRSLLRFLTEMRLSVWYLLPSEEEKEIWQDRWENPYERDPEAMVTGAKVVELVDGQEHEVVADPPAAAAVQPIRLNWLPPLPTDLQDEAFQRYGDVLASLRRLQPGPLPAPQVPSLPAQERETKTPSRNRFTAPIEDDADLADELPVSPSIVPGRRRGRFQAPLDAAENPPPLPPRSPSHQGPFRVPDEDGEEPVKKEEEKKQGGPRPPFSVPVNQVLRDIRRLEHFLATTRPPPPPPLPVAASSNALTVIPQPPPSEEDKKQSIVQLVGVPKEEPLRDFTALTQPVLYLTYGPVQRKLYVRQSLWSSCPPSFREAIARQIPERYQIVPLREEAWFKLESKAIQEGDRDDLGSLKEWVVKVHSPQGIPLLNQNATPSGPRKPLSATLLEAKYALLGGDDDQTPSMESRQDDPPPSGPPPPPPSEEKKEQRPRREATKWQHVFMDQVDTWRERIVAIDSDDWKAIGNTLKQIPLMQPFVDPKMHGMHPHLVQILVWTHALQIEAIHVLPDQLNSVSRATGHRMKALMVKAGKTLKALIKEHVNFYQEQRTKMDGDFIQLLKIVLVTLNRFWDTKRPTIDGLLQRFVAIADPALKPSLIKIAEAYLHQAWVYPLDAWSEVEQALSKALPQYRFTTVLREFKADVKAQLDQAKLERSLASGGGIAGGDNPNGASLQRYLPGDSPDGVWMQFTRFLDLVVGKAACKREALLLEEFFLGSIETEYLLPSDSKRREDGFILNARQIVATFNLQGAFDMTYPRVLTPAGAQCIHDAWEFIRHFSQYAPPTTVYDVMVDPIASTAFAEMCAMEYLWRRFFDMNQETKQSDTYGRQFHVRWDQCSRHLAQAKFFMEKCVQRVSPTQWERSTPS